MVSIIIRTHGNRAINLIKEAINSVKKQTFHDVEIIVIEDGTNNYEKYIDSNIIYKSIPKSGRCVAGNIGLELAKGKYIMFLDDDDQLYPDHISTLIKELEENNTIGAAYSASIEIPTKFISLDPLIYREGRSHKTFAVPFSLVLMWHTNYIPIQSIIFRRTLYEKYGGFDVKMNYFEDWDLWLRYSFHHEFAFVNRVTSFFRVPLEKYRSKDRAKEMNQYHSMICERLKNFKIETNAYLIEKLCNEYQEKIEYTKQPKGFLKEVWYATNIGKKLKTFEQQIRKRE